MFTEQQEKWLKRVDELFLRFGIKSITMDDVARELGTLLPAVDDAEIWAAARQAAADAIAGAEP